MKKPEAFECTKESLWIISYVENAKIVLTTQFWQVSFVLLTPFVSILL